MNLLGWLKRLFGWFWKVVQVVRAAISVLLVIVLLAILLTSILPNVPQVPDRAALVLAPEGDLVDQLSGNPVDRAVARARGLPTTETLVLDLIEAIRHAKDDDRIAALVLRLDALGYAGLSKLQQLANEILLFKESGKRVIAVGGSFDKNQYYLAAHADEIFMNPMGFVFIDGYSRYLPYYREAIDNLLVDFHVWRVGEYKSFVEPDSPRRHVGRGSRGRRGVPRSVVGGLPSGRDRCARSDAERVAAIRRQRGHAAA